MSVRYQSFYSQLDKMTTSTTNRKPGTSFSLFWYEYDRDINSNYFVKDQGYMIPRFLDSSQLNPNAGNNIKVLRFNFYNFFSSSVFNGLNDWSLGAVLVLQFDNPFFNTFGYCQVIRGFSI